ncbi:thiamine phosphate synthase [Beggiatoa leptomitoformis]|uniref:Thiamine-phosphate synthase n=1 Tax=Beggiatoa leptomitoformis TaxID=288004 RepID=A0A2N9YJ67_9GAMM|nr:thiamine phosphate synthase [Beggiatoa leptomitoformis]ALG67519.1 thiamine phosphate synthase [Beggiatoa leptomitoformis]AUI70256.1 thiamine phosphate synthase [Beggiatoa leptomitoformis]
MAFKLRGLYVITDSLLMPTTAELVAGVIAAIQGGARVVQYRDKSTDNEKRLQQALALKKLCQQQAVLFIINDDVGLAKQINADGVHIGETDSTIAQARAVLGQSAIIGASCYASIEMAQQAITAGADYVAFGSFFPSPTKPDAHLVSLAVLQAARRQLVCPIIAIGGITLENGGALITAGADMLSVVSGVFAAKDIAAAARSYTQLFLG